MRGSCHLAFLCLLTACANTPAPKPLLMSATHEPAPPQATRVEWVSATVVTPEDPPRIGKTELDKARALLQQARDELEPRQWALLDGKLTEAEQAWERFSTAARASGRTAEIASGAEGVAEAGRVGEVKSIRALPRVGPLLALLLLLWPSSTAGPAYDELPPWLSAQLELESKLMELAKTSRQVSLEIEAARRESGGKRPSEGASLPRIEKKAWDPAPGKVPENWIYPSGKRPCDFKGTAEPSKVGRPDKMRCTYDCGGRTEVRYFWGTSSEVCLDPFRRPMY